MKALMLAAGYGTRLKPLTEHIPKPLTLFMGRPILDIVFDQIKGAGIIDIAVNTHHLPDVIKQHSQVYKQAGMNLVISHEEEILGTGGCVNPLRAWLGDDSLLIYNGDIVSSVDLTKFVDKFQSSKALAAMVLIPHKEGTTPVYCHHDRVVAIGGESPEPAANAQTFSGIHILSKAFVDEMPTSGFFSVIDTYKKLILAGKPILAFQHEGFWADLGIPKDYLEAHRELWQESDRSKLLEAMRINSSTLDFDEAQNTLFVDAKRMRGMKNSFVFGPVTKSDDQATHIDNCIVYPGVDVTKHNHKSGVIISPKACLSIV